MEKLDQLRETAKQAIESVENLQQLQEKRVLYLGKKGPIQEVMSMMKTLSPRASRNRTLYFP